MCHYGLKVWYLRNISSVLDAWSIQVYKHHSPPSELNTDAQYPSDACLLQVSVQLTRKSNEPSWNFAWSFDIEEFSGLSILADLHVAGSRRWLGLLEEHVQGWWRIAQTHEVLTMTWWLHWLNGKRGSRSQQQLTIYKSPQSMYRSEGYLHKYTQITDHSRWRVQGHIRVSITFSGTDQHRELVLRLDQVESHYCRSW